MGASQSPKTAFRPTITGPSMYALLIREFARLKSPECTHCRVPLPFWGPAPGNQAGYWYMETPRACPYECGQLLAALWARLTTEYQIAPPEAEQVYRKHGARAAVSQG
jgi:hypothetical protein